MLQNETTTALLDIQLIFILATNGSVPHNYETLIIHHELF